LSRSSDKQAEGQAGEAVNHGFQGWTPGMRKKHEVMDSDIKIATFSANHRLTSTSSKFHEISCRENVQDDVNNRATVA